MTVHTTYFGGVGAAADPDPDDLVFGVVQFPKDFVDEIVDRNLPALAPPERLLSTFKTVEEAAERDGEENPSAVAWRSADVEERYLDHLQKSGPQQVFANVREHVRDRRDVWLVCWEKDVRYCHRRLLARELVAGLDVDDDDVISVVEEVERFDLPNTHRVLCLDCAVDEAMEQLDTDDRDEATRAVLGAISG